MTSFELGMSNNDAELTMNNFVNGSFIREGKYILNCAYSLWYVGQTVNALRSWIDHHGINVLYIPNDMPVKNALCLNLSVDIDSLTAY